MKLARRFPNLTALLVAALGGLLVPTVLVAAPAVYRQVAATAIRETSGPTNLTIAGIGNGEILFRNGTTIDGNSGFVYDPVNVTLGFGAAPHASGGRMQAIGGGSAEATTLTTQITAFHNSDAILCARRTAATDAEGCIWSKNGTSSIGSSTNTPIALMTNAADRVTISADGTTATLAEALNLVLGTTTGTKFGTATTQKISFFNSTPIVQPANTTDLRTALSDLGLRASGGATPLDLGGGALTSGTHTISAKRQLQAQGADVASANNLTLGADGNFFEITGTTTINCIETANWQAGSEITLTFAGALTVTDASGGCASTMKPINIGAAYTTSSADTLELRLFDTTEWREVGRSVN